MEPKYKRVLLKISGQALAGEQGTGINMEVTRSVADQIKKLIELGVEVAVVVGGGNFWRGRTSQDMNRETADYIGMLATVMNALALQDVLQAKGVGCRVQTSLMMREVAEPYIWRKAIKELSVLELNELVKACEEKFGVSAVVLLSLSTTPTDTAAALRAVNIQADIILLAKNVDAVYSDDPATNPDAVRYDELTFKEMLDKELQVMDLTAATICKENNMAIQVFGVADEDSMVRAVLGERIGTLIKE